MVASTFDFIATASPAGTAAFSFTSIPQTYTDLVLLVNARVTSSSDITAMQPNGISSNYSSVYYEGNGNTCGKGSSEISYRMGYIPGTNQGSIFSADMVHIFNYASTTRQKTVISLNRFPATKATGTQPFQHQWKAGLLANTAAITSLTIGTANGSTFATNTVYTLYGVKKA